MVSQIVIGKNLIVYEYLKGQSDRGNLVFLHGWRSQKEIWNKVVQGIRQQGIGMSIYALDLPGFGQSPAPKGDWNLLDYSNIVKDFITRLELKNVILVGHSFGGRVAIKLCAAQNHNSPQPSLILREGAIRKLVLVDSAGFPMDSKKKGLMNGIAKLVRPFFKPKFMQPLRKKVYKLIGAEDYIATPELQKIFVNITGEDLTEDLKKIACPTLIVWGEDDKETPLSFGERMHTLILNSKFLILPHAGHFSFLDKPEEFTQVLLEFVRP